MDYDKSFIEVQFPVSKVSKESYKERKAVQGQTLTGLGKWWGRKPLIFIRSAILGLLMPVSDNPRKDREIFLKILTMDENGLWLRKDKSIPQKTLYEYLTPHEKEKYFIEDSNGKIKYRPGISTKEKENIQRLVFNRLSYDEKLKYCKRPEEVKLIDKKEWGIINEHLNTNAYSLEELIQQLGERKFGRTPIVGDCFSGGGSVPFEAARMGLDVYASDLNPIAALLTWAALNIAGLDDFEKVKLEQFQKKVYDSVDKELIKLGIEHNEKGWRGNAYLYCLETICPECGYKVPLLPNFVIGKGGNVILRLVKNPQLKKYDFEVIENVSNTELVEAENKSTLSNYHLVCPNCNKTTPIPSIRRDKDDGIQRPYRYNTPNALRKWKKEDFMHQDDDIFTERLYCIRYEEFIRDENGHLTTVRHYVAPTEKDLERENKVISILREKFDRWQKNGIIPHSPIEAGWNTNQPIYEKGWTHWHHLFNHRQLLIHGLLMEKVLELAETQQELVVGILGVNKCCDWNSRLSTWDNGKSPSVKNTFLNQSLNTLFNYGCRGLTLLQSVWFFNINNTKINSKNIVCPKDARDISTICDFWITDPPYADAVNYHELTEFFLAWDKEVLNKAFPDWYTDSKRILAVRGTGESFNNSMVEIYSNLVKYMPDNGMQIVMFTHQDVKVWAELSMILWSAGLRVTAAWNVATETESGGLKDGNYVKGTVLLVLRKQTSDETAYLDELYPDIEAEVKAQIDSMRELDDKEDPNFSDPDYLLAAYAASLKVLTSYKKIEDIDVKYELAKLRTSNEESPIEKIIQDAVKIAYDYLIPTGFDHYIWKMLTPEERFYIKGLELEKQNVYQLSGYQELARGFGVREYRDLLGNTRANNARLKTASEFAMRGLNDNSKFGSSLLRNVLVAIYLSVKEEDTMKGRNWLKTELVDYWNVRTTIIEILSYISSLQYIENMEHWKEDAYAASMLKELISNDSI